MNNNNNINSNLGLTKNRLLLTGLAATLLLAACGRQPGSLTLPIPRALASATGDTVVYTSYVVRVLSAGVPVSGASLRVYDALTGQQYRLEGNVATDANGNVTLQIASLPAGRILRFVAITDSKTLSGLVGADGVMIGDRRSPAIPFNVVIDDTSTSLDKAAASIFHIARWVRADFALPVLTTLLADLNGSAAKIASYLEANPSVAEELANTKPDNQPALASILTKIVYEAGEKEPVRAAIWKAIIALQGLTGNSNNLDPNARMSTVPLYGLGFTGSIVGNRLYIEDKENGETEILTFLNGQTGTENTNPFSGGGSSGGGSGNTSSTPEPVSSSETETSPSPTGSTEASPSPSISPVVETSPSAVVSPSSTPAPIMGLVGEIFQPTLTTDRPQTMPEFNSADKNHADFLVSKVHTVVDGARNFLFSATLPTNRYGVRLSGNLNVTTAGSYGLKVRSDDNFILYIDGAIALNHDGLHTISYKGDDVVETGNVDLSAGAHTFKIDWFQNDGKRGLDLTWMVPGSASYEAIPASVFTNNRGNVVGTGNWL
jgi:hypothetical protein